jgi:hypothetical protein
VDKEATWRRNWGVLRAQIFFNGFQRKNGAPVRSTAHTRAKIKRFMAAPRFDGFAKKNIHFLRVYKIDTPIYVNLFKN